MSGTGAWFTRASLVAGERVIFVGPSLPASQRPSDPGLTVLPPVRRGDILKILEKGPHVIGIIDGYFGDTASILHKEILIALNLGIQVLGGGSMGAIRAAELHPYGMRGIGWIYEAYKAGEIVADDEVAVLHAPAELGYKALTLPLVNLRITLQKAVRDEELGLTLANAVISAYAATNFRDRTLERLFEIIRSFPGLTSDISEHLLNIILTRWRDQKALDASAVVAQVLAIESPLASSLYERDLRIHTTWINRYKVQFETGHFEVPNIAIWNAARLFIPEYSKFHWRTLKTLWITKDIKICPDECAKEATWTLQDSATHPDEKLLLAEEMRSRGIEPVHAVAWQMRCRLAASHDSEIDQCELLTLRDPSGCLPSTELVLALKLSPLYSRACEIAREMNSLNGAFSDRTGIGYERFSDTFILEDVYKTEGLLPQVIESFWKIRGFEGWSDFLDALKMAFVYRKKFKAPIQNFSVTPDVLENVNCDRSTEELDVDRTLAFQKIITEWT